MAMLVLTRWYIPTNHAQVGIVCCLKKKPATLAAYFIHGQLEIDPLHRILHQQLVASARHGVSSWQGFLLVSMEWTEPKSAGKTLVLFLVFYMCYHQKIFSCSFFTEINSIPSTGPSWPFSPIKMASKWWHTRPNPARRPGAHSQSMIWTRGQSDVPPARSYLFLGEHWRTVGQVTIWLWLT